MEIIEFLMSSAADAQGSTLWLTAITCRLHIYLSRSLSARSSHRVVRSRNPVKGEIIRYLLSLTDRSRAGPLVIS